PTGTSPLVCAAGGRRLSPIASVGDCVDTPPGWSAFCQASYTVPPLGAGTALVTSRRNCFRLGTEEAPNLEPETATSTLKYTGEFASSVSCCSAHSVDPIKPSSSPSQLAKIRVRLGFQPAFS